MLQKGQYVQPVGTMHAASVILHGNDQGAKFVEQARGGAAHVSEALYDYTGDFDFNARSVCGFEAYDEHAAAGGLDPSRSEEHTSELKSLMRISYAVLCLKNNRRETVTTHQTVC